MVGAYCKILEDCWSWCGRTRFGICEVNKCADALANMACDEGFCLMLYEHCPA
jgi:hypothetical protein